MKKFLVTLMVVASLFTGNTGPKRAAAAPPPPIPGKVAQADELSGAEKAVLQAAKAKRDLVEEVPFYDITVSLYTSSADRIWAAVWIIPVHPQTGEVIPTEPGLGLAHWDGKSWQALLPSDPDWKPALENVPSELLPDETRADLLLMNQAIEAVMPTAPISGYLLPWQAGRTLYLTRSTAHDADITSLNAHYAFDFSTAPSALFDLYASKSGTVWLFRDDVPNGTSSQVNYLVMQDVTTVPVTYHLYLHLAQNSIPPGLKVIGAPVVRGQFIGVADDTGASTNHHLHFQVQTQPASGYWSRSVDITFDDVDINGGRPRIPADIPYCDEPGDVCVETRSTYVSGNFGHTDTNAPWGDLTSPEVGFSLGSSNITFAGWAVDNTSLASIRLKVKYGSEWRFIGPTFTSSPFAYSWDVCADQVPDGPVSVALEIRDSDGNYAPGLAGLRHFAKNYSCAPPPTCSPTATQVAIFSDRDFTGDCVILSTGTHASTALGAVGVDNVESVRVGSSVYATLYSDQDASGRGETLANPDSSLSDNRIGLNALSSIKVQLRTQLPSTPRLIWPLDDAIFSGAPSLSVVWDDGWGATEFQVKLNGALKTWQSSASLFLGSLSPGATYTWQVKSRNSAGESAWSAEQSFIIQDAAAPEANLDSAPIIYNWESGYAGWTGSSNWDQTLEQNHTAGGSVSWGYEVSSATSGYDNGIPNYGDLTSPPINIPAGGPYYLRFWYFYETEGPDKHWDQRWIQISVNGSPFSNLLQLVDDPPNIWLQSPALDLSAHAGKTIQLRFHFETLDAAKNAYQGWYIDDLSIDTNPPPTCSSSGEPDNTPAQARSLTINGTLSGIICPGGDVDYYKITLSAGDQIGITTEAQVIGSSLDTFLDFLDGDGLSVLAQNDDQALGVRTDSFLSYRISRSGTYYLKLRAWNHPSVGGSAYTYNIKLFGNDTSRPGALFNSPPNNTFLPNGITSLSVTASDSASGMSHVDFFWHPGDWTYGDWSFVGADWDSADGWSAPFDTTSLSDQRDIAIFARAYDRAGNWFGAGAWNLWLDRTPPVTALLSQPAEQTSTAFLLKWGANDNVSGIHHFDIQKLIGSTWTDWQTGIDGSLKQIWFIGEPGGQYSFRMRGADLIGNTEAYPSSAEISTMIPLDVCTLGDEYENDNDRVSATIVSGVAAVQTHSFCNLAAGSNGLNDGDWFKYTLKGGQRLAVRATPIGTSAAAILQLLSSDGASILTQTSPSAIGETSMLEWRAAIDMTVYLKITHLDGRVAGNAVTYQLWSRQGFPIFLPIVSK